jgi:hypothetical protein
MIEGTFTRSANEISLGFADYTFPVTVAYYETDITLLYLCVDEDSLALLETSDGTSVIPEEYLTYFELLLKGKHIAAFIVMENPDVASISYANTEEALKNVPVADQSDDAKVSDKLANLFSKVLFKNSWKDLTKLTCPTTASSKKQG